MDELIDIARDRRKYEGFLIKEFPELNSQDAEDFISESTVELYKELQKGTEIRDRDGWISAKARRLVIDDLRKRRGRGARKRPRDIEFKLQEHDVPAPDYFTDPSEFNEAELVRNALTELSIAQQKVLWMRHGRGLRVPAIVAAIGLGNRKKYERLHTQARQRLVKLVAKRSTSSECVKLRSLILISGVSKLKVQDQAHLDAHIENCLPCRTQYRLVHNPEKVFAGVAFPAFGFVEVLTGKFHAVAHRFTPGSESIAAAGGGGAAVASAGIGKLALLGCASVLCVGGGIYGVQEFSESAPKKKVSRQRETAPSDPVIVGQALDTVGAEIERAQNSAEKAAEREAARKARIEEARLAEAKRQLGEDSTITPAGTPVDNTQDAQWNAELSAQKKTLPSPSQPSKQTEQLADSLEKVN